MFGIQELLLNVLALIVFILFIPLIIVLKCNNDSHINLLKFISFSLAIISCISFPFTLTNGFIFDLRLIALVIGFLYGGVKNGLLLIGVTVLYRLCFGGIGIIGTIITVVATLILTFPFIKKFNNFTKRKRMLTASLVALLNSSISVIIALAIFSVDFEPLLIFYYLVITAISCPCIVYIYETFHESIYIRQKIIKTEKMEMVSHLASSISHEVRNPLAVVKGFLQLMEDVDLEEKKRKNFLQISINEINRADTIIRNYLTFAKPSPENIEILDIRDELGKTIDMITPLANMNSIIIDTAIKPFFIKGESQLLQQCLLNICKNCIEAMPNNGTLTIETASENNNLHLTIADTGTGMTKEQLARIGEPYFTTKGREGTGLGMMAAMQIISSLQGKIHISSTLNKGTKFLIILPLLNK
ncbi:HAMP domain-containing sensor histidine kinase [Niallia sp. NCCP-28]|uniref:sensor histidine kinase n=1 Tax=Niallia sp. NCCP-28 TaxID=2934712 RepID=UPI002081748B|nr:HAMP domain-containing sensor histidine kinase [Niallia sp. NCCP-28]GKU81396.1 sensor histidine kinase [Niallia sp. NCCP-28]